MIGWQAGRGWLNMAENAPGAIVTDTTGVLVQKPATRLGSAPAIRVIATACLGSALEWYDFFLFGTASALVFGPLFFPKQNPVVGTLLAFMSFGLGFVVRPLGGMLFGMLGDRWGRKPVLVITLLMIGLGTASIGILPTYEQAGIFAPLALVGIRLLQGLGAGAEYGGAVILLVESAPAHRRGFWGGFAPLGVSAGNVLAASAFAAASLLPEAEFMRWGWRIPFLASLLLVAVGFYIRLHVAETPVFQETAKHRRAAHRPGVLAALRQNKRDFLVVFGACMENALGYLFPIFGLDYVIRTVGMPRSTCHHGRYGSVRLRDRRGPAVGVAIRPDRPAPGLYLRCLLRRRGLLLVFHPCGHGKLVSRDPGLRDRPGRRASRHAGGAGGVLRRDFPARTALHRLRHRPRDGQHGRRRPDAFGGGGPAGLVRRGLVAGRPLRRLHVGDHCLRRLVRA